MMQSCFAFDFGKIDEINSELAIIEIKNKVELLAINCFLHLIKQTNIKIKRKLLNTHSFVVRARANLIA